jgi:hypothetical protein
LSARDPDTLFTDIDVISHLREAATSAAGWIEPEFVDISLR